MNQTLLGLQFDTNPYLKGIQLILDFKKYELSVVQPVSYTHLTLPTN